MRTAMISSDEVAEKVGMKPLRLTWSVKTAKFWMIAGMLVTDIAGLAISGSLVIIARRILFGEWRWDLYPQIWPVILGYVVAAAFRGLYPGVGLHPATELRRISTTVTLVVFSLIAFTFGMRTSLRYSRMIFGGIWLIAIVLLPLFRALGRKIMLRLDLWGYPVAIISTGRHQDWLWNFLTNKKTAGLRPVVLIDDLASKKGHKGNQVPHLWWEETETGFQFPSVPDVDTAIVLLEGVPETIIQYLTSGQGTFKHIILLPSFEHIGSLGVSPFTIDGILGLKVRNNLLNQVEQQIKRWLDIIFVCVGGIIISPILLTLSALIKWTSAGPVFYGHERVGRGGQHFKAWKFRTMVQNADQVLQDYLAKDPALQAEWETTYKLKNDPRVTSIGRFLRKFSLDELPQLWNILIGEMSLVGPRPIVESEIEKYSQNFELYKQVRPGLTGLWQVSGRNNTTYEERVYYDGYYVQNWSIWLDIYILIKTIWVVISRDGAY